MHNNDPLTQNCNVLQNVHLSTRIKSNTDALLLVYLVTSFISCVRLYTVDKLKRFIPRLLPQ
jgi:hypothetical protein